MKSDSNQPLPGHSPAPSYAPPLIAAGLLFLLWGVVTTWILSAVGLLLTGFASALWIGGVSLRVPAARARSFSWSAEIPAGRRGATAPSPIRQAVPQGPWVHRCALLLALCALSVVVTGAMVTSSRAAASPSLERFHWILGTLAGMLAIYVCIRMRGLSWVLPAGMFVEAALGGRGPAVAALHAFLAHLFFAASVATALLTSRSWKREPDWIDLPKLSLRSFAVVTVGLVLVQVALGAAVRHKLMGSGLHITFALVVALATVCLGVMAMNQCGPHKAVRPCSIMIMVIAGMQVFLGFGAFIMGMMADESSLPVVIATVAHVTTGSLTLAATVVLALQLRRHLRVTAARKPAAA